MIVDTRAKFDFLDLDDLLLLLGFVLFLLFFVFIFSEIKDLANGRIGVGRDLDEIEAGIRRHIERFVARNDPHHVAAFVNEPKLVYCDFAIDPRAIAARGGIKGWSGYLGSPSVVQP
jgi:hypothetical protein